MKRTAILGLGMFFVSGSAFALEVPLEGASEAGVYTIGVPIPQALSKDALAANPAVFCNDSRMPAATEVAETWPGTSQPQWLLVHYFKKTRTSTCRLSFAPTDTRPAGYVRTVYTATPGGFELSNAQIRVRYEAVSGRIYVDEKGDAGWVPVSNGGGFLELVNGTAKRPFRPDPVQAPRLVLDAGMKKIVSIPGRFDDSYPAEVILELASDAPRIRVEHRLWVKASTPAIRRWSFGLPLVAGVSSRVFVHLQDVALRYPAREFRSTDRWTIDFWPNVSSVPVLDFQPSTLKSTWPVARRPESTGSRELQFYPADVRDFMSKPVSAFGTRPSFKFEIWVAPSVPLAADVQKFTAGVDSPPTARVASSWYAQGGDGQIPRMASPTDIARSADFALLDQLTQVWRSEFRLQETAIKNPRPDISPWFDYGHVSSSLRYSKGSDGNAYPNFYRLNTANYYSPKAFARSWARAGSAEDLTLLRRWNEWARAYKFVHAHPTNDPVNLGNVKSPYEAAAPIWWEYTPNRGLRTTESNDYIYPLLMEYRMLGERANREVIENYQKNALYLLGVRLGPVAQFRALSLVDQIAKIKSAFGYTPWPKLGELISAYRLGHPAALRDYIEAILNTMLDPSDASGLRAAYWESYIADDPKTHYTADYKPARTSSVLLEYYRIHPNATLRASLLKMADKYYTLGELQCLSKEGLPAYEFYYPALYAWAHEQTGKVQYLDKLRMLMYSAKRVAQSIIQPSVPKGEATFLSKLSVYGTGIAGKGLIGGPVDWIPMPDGSRGSIVVGTHALNSLYYLSVQYEAIAHLARLGITRLDPFLVGGKAVACTQLPSSGE